MFADENPRSSGQRTALGIGTVVYFTAIIAAIFLARRNLRLGRGDRKGAFRVALFMLIVVFIGSVLKGHHAFARRVEMNVFFESLTAGLRSSAFWWLFYIALEPYVRRLRPGLLISWTRLISGDFRNPMVGRDVLIGGLLASTMALLSFLYYSFIEPGTSGTSLNPDTLLGMRTSLGVVLHDVFAPGVQFGMYWLFLLLLFFTIFRKTVPALAGTWLIVAVMSIAGALAWPLAAVFAALVTLAVSRFGLLTSISFYTLLILLGTIPVSSDFARWYAVTGITFLLGIGVILVFCFHIATGDKALFRDSLLARQSY